MTHPHDDLPFFGAQPPEPTPGDGALDATSAQPGASSPWRDLAQVMIVGRDGPWALVFVPMSRDLVWIDLERTPFQPQDYNPLIHEDDFPEDLGGPGPDASMFPESEWDGDGCWPL